jgi:hypothetical protein
MPAKTRRLPSPALIVSMLALVVAIGGGSFALATSTATKEKKIAKRVAKQLIHRKAPGLSVNHARSADMATHAISADQATHADSATTADSATNAANADQLDNLDSSQLLRSSSRGVGLTGARVTGTGTVLSYFNRNGGVPVVTHTANSGVYTLSFPGTPVNVNFEILQATIAGGPGEVAVSSVNGNAIVQTFNSNGTAADRQFTLTVLPGGPNG